MSRVRLASVLLACMSQVTQSQTLSFTRDSGVFFDGSVDLSKRAIASAWADLRRDWYKVIGTVLVQQPSLPAAGQPLASDSWLQFYINSSMPAESFTIEAQSAAGYSYLAVTGADTRGLIYGMYHVSGDILGVDPYWWFLDLQPSYAGTISVPASYSYSSGAPVFYSRGAFVNDEDISAFFFPDPLGASVYSADVANRYAETLLRLRVNTVIPSTFGYADERHYQLYQNRGFMLSNHHVTVLGVNTYAWPQGVPYTYRLNPEPLQEAWRSMAAYQQYESGREMIYAVGYRGMNDYPFWQDDTACNTDQCRGQTISEAMANQTAIVQATPVAPGVQAPRFATFLQMEMLSLLQEGVLKIPPGVSTIWTDFDTCFTIGGIVNASAGDGFYAHLAAMSGWPLGGSSGQLTEWATMATAFANMWAMWAKNATFMGMINVSDLKHIPLTAEAAFKYLWNPQAFNATQAGCSVQRGTAVEPEAKSGGRRAGPRGPVGWWPMPAGLSQDGSFVQGCDLTVTPSQAQETFFVEFATRHYASPANATALPQAIADIHSSYFNLSYQRLTWPMGDHYFGTSLRGLMEPFQADVSSNNHNNALIGQAMPLLGFAEQNLQPLTDLFVGRILPLQQYVPEGGPAGMYAGHVVAQVAIHYYHTVAFQALGNGAVAWANNDVSASIANVTAALEAINTCLDYMRLGEGNGIWRGMYASETWTWVVGTRGRMSSLLASLRGQAQVVGPTDVYADGTFMAYECPSHSSTACNTFPLAVFNGTIAWDVMTRVTCPQDAPPGHADAAPSLASAAGCTTTVMGISYSGPSTQVALWTAPHPARGNAPAPVIRFTTDGSPVGPTATLYTAPFPVTGNATVRAQSFDAVSGQALVVENQAQVTTTG